MASHNLKRAADDSISSATSLGDATMANLRIKTLFLFQAIFVFLGSVEGKQACFIKVLRPQIFDLTTLFRFDITISVKMVTLPYQN